MKVKHRKIDNPYNLSLLFGKLLECRAQLSFPECLDYLTRLILIELSSSGTNMHKNPIAEKAALWIRANSDIILKTSKVALHLGYNSDYLNRIFKKNYGKSVKEYIDEAYKESYAFHKSRSFGNRC